METWLWIIPALLLIAAISYWQLVIAEGTYLGQRVVTWLYDITAKRYDSIKGFDSSIESLFLGKPLAAALHNIPAPFVLDIGTGTGRLPMTLLEQPEFQGQVIGIDHSRRMLAVAAKKTYPRNRLHLIWHDASRLPFKDASFDAVTCLEMLEFTPNPDAQIAEAIRVLRPGGVLLITRRRGFDARLMPGKTYSIDSVGATLAKYGMRDIALQRWQVDYDLLWCLRAGRSSQHSRSLQDVLSCTHCNQPSLLKEVDLLLCQNCAATYLNLDGVFEMI